MSNNKYNPHHRDVSLRAASHSSYAAGCHVSQSEEEEEAEDLGESGIGGGEGKNGDPSSCHPELQN